jgi:hypothetical protein
MHVLITLNFEKPLITFHGIYLRDKRKQEGYNSNIIKSKNSAISNKYPTHKIKSLVDSYK